MEPNQAIPGDAGWTGFDGGRYRLDRYRLRDCDLHDGTWLTADGDWLPGPARTHTEAAAEPGQPKKISASA